MVALKNARPALLTCIGEVYRALNERPVDLQQLTAGGSTFRRSLANAG